MGNNSCHLLNLTITTTDNLVITRLLLEIFSYFGVNHKPEALKIIIIV